MLTIPFWFHFRLRINRFSFQYLFIYFFAIYKLITLKDIKTIMCDVSGSLLLNHPTPEVLFWFSLKSSAQNILTIDNNTDSINWVIVDICFICVMRLHFNYLECKLFTFCVFMSDDFLHSCTKHMIHQGIYSFYFMVSTEQKLCCCY